MAQFNMSGQRVINQVNVGSAEFAQRILAMVKDAQAAIDDKDILSGVLYAIEVVCQEQLQKEGE